VDQLSDWYPADDDNFWTLSDGTDTIELDVAWLDDIADDGEVVSLELVDDVSVSTEVGDFEGARTYTILAEDFGPISLTLDDGTVFSLVDFQSSGPIVGPGW
jgi:hypothetical protein